MSSVLYPILKRTISSGLIQQQACRHVAATATGTCLGCGGYASILGSLVSRVSCPLWRDCGLPDYDCKARCPVNCPVRRCLGPVPRGAYIYIPGAPRSASVTRSTDKRGQKHLVGPPHYHGYGRWWGRIPLGEYNPDVGRMDRTPPVCGRVWVPVECSRLS